MVSQVEYAILSKHVYRKVDGPPLPAGWESISSRSNPDTGFYAEAYRNAVTGEVVVALRGSENFPDFVNDANFLLSRALSQEPQAKLFLQNVFQKTGHRPGPQRDHRRD